MTHSSLTNCSPRGPFSIRPQGRSSQNHCPTKCSPHDCFPPNRSRHSLRTVRPVDRLPLGPFAPWTVCLQDRSPRGPFASGTVRPVDRLPSGPFAPWTVCLQDRSPRGPFSFRTVRPVDCLPSGPFAPWTVCCQDRSPRGPFAFRTVRPLDPLLSGLFAPPTFRKSESKEFRFHSRFDRVEIASGQIFLFIFFLFNIFFVFKTVLLS